MNLNLNLKKSDLDLRKLQWVHQNGARPAALYIVIFGGAWTGGACEA